MTGWRRFGLAAIGYTVLALLLVRNLFGQFSTAVPHDLGDPLLSTWILWWNAHHLPFVGTWWDGLSFFPEHGSLALSDHRVGLDLLAGPVQWLGGSPVLAYNITFVAGFVSSALGAHALGWTLTRSHAAGVVAGIVFGFNPYRMAHLAHLELQTAGCLPLALLALHRYLETKRPRWLIAFSALLVLQGLCGAYYLFFSIPLVALWIVWFARDAPRRQLAIATAWTASFAVLLPVLLQYQAIQSRLGLGRTFGEMQDFSADLLGLFSAEPGLLLWRVPSFAAHPEAEVYVGIIAPLLVVAAMSWPRRGDNGQSAMVGRIRLACAAIALIFTTVAVSTWWGGWKLRFGPVLVSADVPEKPLTVVFVACLVLVLTSTTWRTIWRRRSTLAFYVLAGIVSWLFSLGPGPRVLGHPLLYRGPYALLMMFPPFSQGLRVPARFAMLVALALAAAAAIAFARISALRSPAVRPVLAILVVGLLIADNWVAAPPAAAVPPVTPTLPQLRGAVLELPLGDVFGDIAATYRSIGHGLPVVNGYSGYEPLDYRILRLALSRHDSSILSALASFAPLLIRIDPASADHDVWTKFVGAVGGATTAPGADPIVTLPQQPITAPQGLKAVPIRVVRAAGVAVPIQVTPGGGIATSWRSAAAQRSGDELLIELDAPAAIREVDLGTGADPLEFPAALQIDISSDGREWRQQWSGGCGGPAFLAALDDARHPGLRLLLSGVAARFVRVRQLWDDGKLHWSVASITVRG
jgi:hypothetical protein